MEIIADDVKNLNGLQVYDAFNKDTFTMKATVLLHVFDYPGQNKVFHSQGTLLALKIVSCHAFIPIACKYKDLAVHYLLSLNGYVTYTLPCL